MEATVLPNRFHQLLLVLKMSMPLLLVFLSLNPQFLLQGTNVLVLLHDLLIQFLNEGLFLNASVCRVGVIFDGGLSESQFLSDMLDQITVPTELTP